MSESYSKEEVLGAYKALRSLLKNYDRVEYDDQDYFPLTLIEDEMNRFYKLYKLLN